MDLPGGFVLKERYRILRKLGQGGMGSVYLARDDSLEVDVALKTRRREEVVPGQTAESATLFLREARLLASLRHPNLPRVTDYFSVGEEPYLVMDYVPGEDLEGLLQREGRQPLERILAWARQLGSALSYMHHRDPAVIHRDIKPANIKLSAEGEAVLVDFGIAKTVAADQSTATSLRGYTPGYAPPEQYGWGRTSPLSDQYSLAATFYTLLCGQKPVEAIQRVLGQASSKPLSDLAEDISPAVSAVFERAMAIKPEERYADVDAFLAALQESARQPWQPYSHRDAASAASAAPTVARSAPTSPPPGAGASPRISSGGRPGWVIPLVILGACFVLALAGGGGLVLARLFFLSASPTPAIALAPGETATTAVQPTEEIPSPSVSPSPSPTLDLIPTFTLTGASLPSETALPPSATPTPPLLGRGGWIAFASDRGDGKILQIWIMQVWLNDQGQVQAGEARQVTEGAGDKRQPAWSPDGKELLYVAPGGEGLGLDIWKIALDRSVPAVNLTRRKGDQTDPAWSPDGKRIAFTDDSRADGVLMLYLIDPTGADGPNGGNLIRLSYDQQESDPAWAPNMKLGFILNAGGSRILFVRSADDPTATTPQPPYYVTPQAFDRTALGGSMGQVGEPAWSPDGTLLVYTRLKPKGERIFLARLPIRDAATDIIGLTQGSRDLSPSWSPDGQWIVFTSYRDGNPEIYIMRSTGQNQNRLSDAPGLDLDPAWQPVP